MDDAREHPYRNPTDALRRATQPIYRVALRDVRDALEWLQHEDDLGNLEFYFSSETREQVAGWMQSLRQTAQAIKLVAEPAVRLLRWVAAALTGFGLLVALGKLQGGPYFVVGALMVAAIAALLAERVQRWLSLAVQVETVIGRLGKIAEKKPSQVSELAAQELVHTAPVKEAIESHVRSALGVAGTRVRVSPELPAPVDHAPKAPHASKAPRPPARRKAGKR